MYIEGERIWISLPLGISYLDNKNTKGQIYKSNKKINKDDKPRITSRSTIEHEIIGIQKTLDTIPSDIRPYKNINLIGDKGYISKNKYNIFDKTVKIITPIRKNEKSIRELCSLAKGSKSLEKTQKKKLIY